MNVNNSDSDSSDEDYNPDKEKKQELSEEETDDELGEPSSDKIENVKKGKRRSSKTSRQKKKIKKDISEEKVELTEKSSVPKDEQKRVDALWSDFMKDTGFKPRSELLKSDSTSKSSANSTESKPPKTSENRKEETVKVTQIFDFAGEEVRVEKEVPVGSSLAKNINKTNKETISVPNSSNKPQRGGLNSFLSQIGKKNKITTLEKSKLDWDRFKKEEHIEDELKAYGKSKDGFLERQDFLQRTDVRQFEIEKNVRSIVRANRVNNGS